MNTYNVRGYLIKGSGSRSISTNVKAESDFMAKTLAEAQFAKTYRSDIANGYQVSITEIIRR